MFPASRGLFCLVFGGRQEKRSPKTRDNCRPLLFPVEVENSEGSSGVIDVGNSIICSDIWHKYHEWYFEIVIRNFTSRVISRYITSGIYAKYHAQIMLLFVYTTTHKRFVIFTCRYFKLRWNTTALSQSNCRNFPRSSITYLILVTSLPWGRNKFLTFDC